MEAAEVHAAPYPPRKACCSLAEPFDALAAK
jgi:hypothetical protein